ncbi:MAG TPA: hypothetical protein VGX23_10590 [Actinocrinis sp.]|nr:hypothetical protein [Actinocrinis sp.]
MSNGNAFTDGRDSVMRALASRGWLIGALVVLGGVAGYAYGAVSPASYTSNAYLVVVPLAASSTNGTAPDAQGFATAFTRIAGQPQIQAEAATDAGVPLDTMIKDSTAATSPDAPVISITGVSTNPKTAAAVANGLAKAIEASAQDQTANTAVTVSVLSAAVPTNTPSSASASLDAAVGAAAGVLIGSLLGLAGVKLGRGGSGRDGGKRRTASAGAGGWPSSDLDATAAGAKAGRGAEAPVVNASAETIQMSALDANQLSILDPKGVSR